MIRLLMILLVAVLASGCAARRITPPPTYNATCFPIEKSNGPERSWGKLRLNRTAMCRCDAQPHLQLLAPYAVMSANAYATQPYQVEIPGWDRPDRYTSWTGFGADVYKHQTNDAWVIAYRGTTPNCHGALWDMMTGNCPIWGRWVQYSQAKGVYKKVYAQAYGKPYEPDADGSKITVTGHSLGGGMATHIGMYYKGVDLYTFNRSPLIFSPWFRKPYKAKRVDVEETGEMLNWLRNRAGWVYKAKLWYGYRVEDTYRIDVLSGWFGAEHGIYKHAQALSRMANEKIPNN